MRHGLCSCGEAYSPQLCAGIGAHCGDAVREVSAGRRYITSRPIRRSPLTIRSKGGAGRPGSRPVASDLIAWGAKNALLGRLRRPPGAWIGLSTGYRRGLGGSTLPHSQAPGRRLGGLPTNQPTHWTAAPRLPIEARCRPPPSSSPRRGEAQESISRGACHYPSTLIINTD